jgi:serine/threonine protein kinase/Flp pilus assembly protein TadD
MGIKCPKCQSDNPDTQKFCGECATPLPSADNAQVSFTKTLETPVRRLEIGSIFAGRYEILDELGKGGMGEVYRVKDEKLDEEMALKVLKPEIATYKGTIERFKNELKLARKIAHKHVCKMYDLNEEEETPYITMEYVKGEDLKSFIRSKSRLTQKEAITIAKQVCEGLAGAHELGVIHRDLKPQNIMIDEKSNAKVMDFGIARSVEAAGLTQTGVMIGTPDYMSPEQAEGEEADQRSDIYALGVILYEMVTGSVPFKGDTVFSVALKHKSKLPSDPKKLNPDVSENLSRLILICMEKERERRYQTTEALLADLRNIEDGLPLGTKIRPRRETFVAALIRKKLFIPAVVVALAIITVAIWQLLPRKGAIPLTPSDKSSLAIMYFKNNTGDESLDYWRTMLSDLLIQDLFQSKYIRVLSESRLLNILEELNQTDARSYSSKVLQEVAVRGKVDYILHGNYAKAGDIIRISVTLQDSTTMELIASEGVEGKGQESIFTMVDELTKKVKTHFQLSEEEIAGDIDREVGQITTSSPEAYEYYSEGRRHHYKGKHQQSIQSMERAIAIDPEFAMAYRSMAWSYNGLGYRSSKWKDYIEKAYELSDRLSDRERYLIQGDFYMSSVREYDEAIENYNKLLKLYPEDVSGNKDLAALYYRLEQWDKGIERLEVLTQNKVSDIKPYTLLSSLYMAKGLYDKSREILDDYLNEFPDNGGIHRQMAFNYLSQGKHDLAQIEIDKATVIDPDHPRNFLIKGHIYHLEGDIINAEKEYQNILNKANQAEHQMGRSWIGHLYLLQGKFEKSRTLLKQGLELAIKLREKGSESGFYSRIAYSYLKSEDIDGALEESKKSERSAVEEKGCLFCHHKWALIYKGLAYVEKKSMAEAQRTAVELKDLIQKGLNRNYMRLYFHLVGMKELENGNFSEAIEHFEKSTSLLPYQHQNVVVNDHAFFIDALASAYYKSGDFDRAQEEYERIISLTLGRLHWPDIYVKSFYMLGKIFEEKGWKGKAIEHYQKFLDLWKDADPGIPEVEDARKRLAGLKKD